MDIRERSQSGVKRKGFCILIVVIIIYAAILAVKLTIPSSDTFQFFVRLFALWGYTSLSISAIMTPFLKEIFKNFGRPFVRIHHIFAYLGLGLITLHPIFSAFQTLDLSVFLPSFASWFEFWLYGGRPALIILYIGLLGVLLYKKIKPWRILHMLVYLVILMGFVHGMLIGTDFTHIGVKIIFSILLVLTAASFVLKRIQRHKLKKNIKRSTA